MSTTLITSRDPKGQQTFRLLEAAYDKTGLTDAQAQHLNERGGELVTGFKQLITDLAFSDLFKDEETSSSYIYPDGYEILPIEEQVAKLKELFPELNGANLEIAKGELPEGAEGWFAIPRPDKLAKTYNAALDLVLAKLGKSRKFYNYRNGETSGKYLRQNQRTIAMWNQLADQQAGYDILIVPCQFGLKHRGRSVCRARECFAANEFGLGAFATGCMLLTHPKRLQRWEQLHWDCGGDDYDWSADGQWTYCPYFDFRGDEVEFYAGRVDDVYQYFGSASAFLGSAETLEA